MEELLTPKEMGQADRLANNETALMDAAGRAVARAIMQRYRPCRVLVLRGPGNNGGDGVVTASYLTQAGWPVEVVDFRAARIAQINKAELVVDAVFGAGLSRDVGEPVAGLLQATRRIVAIDVPSGVDGATGAMRGYAPQAELTVTFFRLKPGHLLFPGRALCGEILLRDIGMPEAVLETVKPQAWRNGPWLWSLPGRTATGHKYTSGDVTVLGGHMGGAARLACAAARRCGAGMVTLVADQPLVLPEAGLIVRTDSLAGLMKDHRRTTWVCGPGLGIERAGAALSTLIEAGGRNIVADADALTACAGVPSKLRGAAVITPHEGEFARVFGPIGDDRLEAVRAAAVLTGAVTLLKGAATVIAAPDGRAVINDNAPPWLATGGTGDVLSGVIAALLAQGMDAFEAACAGAWLHGAAAQEVGPGLIAEDLPDALAKVATRMTPADR
jgi:hydroxyethylthiazole kinase-like uncharacterized protein yjeF